LPPRAPRFDALLRRCRPPSYAASTVAAVIMLGAGRRFQILFCRFAGTFLKQTDVAHSK
jgi:hypothetical protein